MKDVFSDRITQGMIGALAVLVLLEATIIPHKHPEFPWHFVPGYAAAIGLFGCIGVVLFSKWLGKTVLQRPEEGE